MKISQSGVVHTLPLLIIIAVIGIITFLLLTSTAPFSTGLFKTLNPKNESHAAVSALPTPFPNCTPYGGITPLGQAVPDPNYPTGYDPVTRTGGLEAEPLGPIWCFPLVAPTQPTRIAGANDWIDDFNTGVQMGRLNDGDMDYHVFMPRVNGVTSKGQVFVNANHWMIDLAMMPNASDNRPSGEVAISPNKSFHAEDSNGQPCTSTPDCRLVIETDVAFANDALGGADNFVEIDVSPAAAPDADRDYYGYAQFMEGSVGCRIQTNGSTDPLAIVCAQFNPFPKIPPPFDNTEPYPGAPCESKTNPAGTGWNCLDNADAYPDANGDGHNNRIWETQGAGCTDLGGCTQTPNRAQFFRTCQHGQMDYFCRDRIRMEIFKNHLDIYVNGGLTDTFGPFLQSMPVSNTCVGCDARIQDSIMSNAHVYFAHWINDSFSLATTTRTHWDRVAINPHNPGRTDMQPPSIAPSYCYGQPQNTCPIITQITDNTGINVPAQNTVELLDYVINQPDTTVLQGQSLTFVNKGNQPHSATADDGSWDTGILNPGQSKTITFNTVGITKFHCVPHAFSSNGTWSGMVGTVSVFSSNGATPLPSTTPLPSATPVTSGTTYTATMNGAQNVPAVTTNGTGTATLILSSDHTAATLTMSYSGLTSTANAAHIHGPAAPNQNIAALFGLNYFSGTAGTSASNMQTTITGLTAQQVTDLTNGYWYVNVHSVNFPSGEIRGTLLRSGQTPPPNATATPTPTPTPIVTQTPGPTSMPGTTTVTFDGGPAVGTLNGQYPTGVINWGTNGAWLLSGPFSSFNTNSVSFNGATPTSGTFTFVTSARLLSLQAANGGSGAATITIACSGNSTVTQSVPVNQLTTITTSWTNVCTGPVTITSSNGWNTNFDNLVVATGSGTTPTPTPSAGKPGDIDGNGTVDIFDYNIEIQNFGKACTFSQGDLDGNGTCNIFDYNILLTNFGK